MDQSIFGAMFSRSLEYSLGTPLQAVAPHGDDVDVTTTTAVAGTAATSSTPPG